MRSLPSTVLSLLGLATAAACGASHGPGPSSSAYLLSVSPRGSTILFSRTAPGGVLVGASSSTSACGTRLITAAIKRRGSTQSVQVPVEGPPPTSIVLEAWAPLDGLLVAIAPRGTTSVVWKSDANVPYDAMAPRSNVVAEVGPSYSLSPSTSMALGQLVAMDGSRVIATTAVSNVTLPPPTLPGQGCGP